MKNKKKSAVLLCVLFALSGCAALTAAMTYPYREVSIHLDPEYNETISQEEMAARGHRSVLADYTTDVSTAYKNEDGTQTLYVYASPIRYRNEIGQWSMIDTRIANVTDQEKRQVGYLYATAQSDIRAYYPRTLTDTTGWLIENQKASYCISPLPGLSARAQYRTFTNFIGEEKAMIVYRGAAGEGTELRLYPSSLGSNCEVIFHQAVKNPAFSLLLTLPDKDIRIRQEPGGYLLVYRPANDDPGEKTEEILGVVQPPLLKTKDGKINYCGSLHLTALEEGRYRMDFFLDVDALDNSASVFLSFELRREKQPDNALYSLLPDLEYAYLKNYSVIGQSEEYGIGRLMIRYKFAKLFQLRSSQILQAEYDILSLSPGNFPLEMRRVLEDWCSLTGNWNKHYAVGERVSLWDGEGPEIKFDITEEVKAWCDDTEGQMEHNGVELMSVDETAGSAYVLLSNDNTLYHNRTIITFHP